MTLPDTPSRASEDALKLELHALMHQALSSPHGIACTCSDVLQVSNLAYALRKEKAEEPELYEIIFRAGPNGELWMTKRTERAQRALTTAEDVGL